MEIGGKTVLDTLLAWQRLADVGKRPATVRYHAQTLSAFRRFWPDLTMAAASVTSDDVSTFVLRVAHFSAPFFNALVSVLKSQFCDAARAVKRRPVTPKHVILPGQAEFAALLREIDQAHHGQAALVVRFLALTGMRIGEAAALQWSAVTPRGLLVPGASTKNGRPRLIPYIGSMRSVLERLRSLGTGEGSILPQASCRRALAGACARAGLKTLTHHDLRRIWATRVLESGVDLPTASRWFGHGDGGALMGKSYFHLLDEHSARMAGRVQIAA